MADEANREGASPLPPKLDLRKSGILKPPTAATLSGDDPPTQFLSAPAPAPVPLAPAPAAAPTPVVPMVPRAAPAPAAAPAPMASPSPSPAATPASAIRMDAKPAAGPGGAPRAPVGGPRPAATAAGQPWRPGGGAAPRPMGAIPLGAKREGTAPSATPPGPTTTPASAAGSAGAPRPLVSKKDTARIPLDAAKPRAMPVAGAGEAPKVASAESSSALRITRPGETAQIGGLPKPVDIAAAEKRKTSRISLDSVLSDSPASESGGPKTIRLKRPGEAPTSKVGGGATSEGEAESPVESVAGATQRKTVIVKRTQESASARKLSVARTGGAAAPSAVIAPELSGEPSAQVHWIFAVFSIAAALVLCVVIYLFAAQAIGPNSSMLQYSSWTGGPNLAWPGKTSWNP